MQIPSPLDGISMAPDGDWPATQPNNFPRDHKLEAALVIVRTYSHKAIDLVADDAVKKAEGDMYLAAMRVVQARLEAT